MQIAQSAREVDEVMLGLSVPLGESLAQRFEPLGGFASGDFAMRMECVRPAAFGLELAGLSLSSFLTGLEARKELRQPKMAEEPYSKAGACVIVRFPVHTAALSQALIRLNSKAFANPNR